MTHDRAIALKTGWKAAVILAATVLTVGMFGFWHLVRYPREVEAQMRDQALLLLDIAENGLRAHLRADSYQPEHLEDWFVGLSVAARLGGIRLVDGSGSDMLAVGPYFEPDETVNRNDFIELERSLPTLEGLQPRGWRRDGPMRGPGPPRGRGMGMGWLPLPEGPYRFTVALDRTPWRAELRALRVRTVLGASLALACGLLLTALVAHRDRQAQLNRALGAARQREARQTMLAQLGAGLAHETKNPLGIIRGLAQGIRDKAGHEPDILNRALRIVDETDRVTGQIDGFLALARPIEPQPAPLRPKALFQGIRDLMQDEADAAAIALRIESEDLVVLADRELLRRALLNLVLNAFKACANGGTVTLSAQRDDSGTVCIAVNDTGCGIAPEDLPNITTPYFTRFQDGVGLGLALTEEIARAHGWRLAFRSAPGQGTEAVLADIAPAEDTV